MAREYILKPFRPAVDLQIDYQRELNEQQLAAVTSPPGPALVLAGAGAGKTRTLIYRVAFLLEQGIPADRILLLTFTNKAAREMMGRVSELLGEECTPLWGGTFHSIGHRILRRHGDRLGFPAGFTILDREDARALLKTCIGEGDYESSVTRFPKPEVVADIFSLAANTGRGLPEMLAERYPHFGGLAPVLEELSARFQARKRATHVMDFDDLLVLWWRLFRENPDLLERYQRLFQFVLVDEYQDTNILQADLIDLLAARHQNLMVVGDDAQSIYSWRGAHFLNILEFPKRYPKAAVFKIETNYRSTPEILQVANAALKANERQFAKELAAVRHSGAKPVVAACGNGVEQAAFVAQRLLELREEGTPLERMAVLYRSHFHALELQMELTRRNIPFSITSGIRFFEQAHIKDVAAYLKLLCNPADELAFKRIVQWLPGIGAKAAEKLWSSFQAARPTNASTPLAERLQRCAALVPKKTTVDWTDLVVTFSQLEDSKLAAAPAKRIELIVESNYAEYLEEAYPDFRSRLEDLGQLAVFARAFSSTEDLLGQLALLTNLEAEEGPAARDQEQVRLSTVHQAKGLEFDVVFVIMLCDGLFPSARSAESQQGEEEERRLFYVAVTRARKELYLSYPLMRAIGGHGPELFQQPSRFLREIPDPLVEIYHLRTG